MRARAERLPDSSWQRCQITQAKGKRRQVRYVDELVALDNYVGQVRQLIVTGLGHESPTFFLTNDRPKRQTAREVIQTYTSRNDVENRLGEQITFFHLDCLGSAVRLNVDFDLTLTVVADRLDRGLAERLKGFAQASPPKLFRKFVDTPGSIPITAEEIVVRLSKRAPKPLLHEARLTQRTRAVPWLGGRRVGVECPCHRPRPEDACGASTAQAIPKVACRSGKLGQRDNPRPSHLHQQSGQSRGHRLTGRQLGEPRPSSYPHFCAQGCARHLLALRSASTRQSVKRSLHHLQPTLVIGLGMRHRKYRRIPLRSRGLLGGLLGRLLGGLLGGLLSRVAARTGSVAIIVAVRVAASVAAWVVALVTS